MVAEYESLLFEIRRYDHVVVISDQSIFEAEITPSILNAEEVISIIKLLHILMRLGATIEIEMVTLTASEGD